MVLRFTCAALLLVGVYSPSAAQTPPDRYECDIIRRGSQERLHVAFIYQPGQDTATMVGNNGVGEVTAVPGTALLSFIEVLANGSVQTTSIDSTGAVVHSRHSFSGKFVHSQWTGRCTRS